MVNVGIIGCGYWGKNLIRNFIETEGCWLAAVADTRTEIQEMVRKRHSSLKVFADYNDLLRLPDIDAVAIATPIGTHFSLALAALEAGKHVLVEKPLAASCAEAEQLLEAARTHDRRLMVDHTFLFTGSVKKIKEVISGGQIGEIRYYDSVRVNLGLFQRDKNVMWDLAPHDLSIMDFLLDEKPVSVSAQGVAHVQEGVENIAYLYLKFKSNLIAHFHFNWLSPVKIRLTLIGGSEKMVVYDDTLASEKVKIYDKKVMKASPENEYKPLYDYRIGDMWSPKVDLGEALANVCREFIAAITEHRTPVSDGICGLRVVKILEAASLSIKQGGRDVPLQL